MILRRLGFHTNLLTLQDSLRGCSVFHSIPWHTSKCRFCTVHGRYTEGHTASCCTSHRPIHRRTDTCYQHIGRGFHSLNHRAPWSNHRRWTSARKRIFGCVDRTFRGLCKWADMESQLGLLASSLAPSIPFCRCKFLQRKIRGLNKLDWDNRPLHKSDLWIRVHTNTFRRYNARDCCNLELRLWSKGKIRKIFEVGRTRRFLHSLCESWHSFPFHPGLQLHSPLM